MMLIVVFCVALVNAQFYDLNGVNRHDFNEHYKFYKLDNQWKPMGRSDPLKNDPTFDYLPPVLKKVNYWIDPSLRKSDIYEILMKNGNEAAAPTLSRTAEKAYLKSDFAPTSGFFSFSPSRNLLKNFNYHPLNKMSHFGYSQPPIKTIRNHEINSLLNFFIEKNFEQKPSASSNSYTFSSNNYNSVKPSVIEVSKVEPSFFTTTSRPKSFSIIEGHSKVKKYGSSASTASDLSLPSSRKDRKDKKHDFYTENVQKRDVDFKETEFAVKYNVSTEQTTEEYTKGIVI